MDRSSVSVFPPGRSVRPIDPAKSVSPASRMSMRGQVKAEAALGVARRVQHIGTESADRNGIAVIVEAGVGLGNLRRGDAEPAGLQVHHAHQRQIELIVENRRAGDGFELLRPGDVVDVRVRDDDLFDREVVARKHGEDARNVAARIDDDGLARGLIAKDGAVALQQADGEGFADQRRLSGRTTKRGPDRLALVGR